MKKKAAAKKDKAEAKTADKCKKAEKSALRSSKRKNPEPEQPQPKDQQLDFKVTLIQDKKQITLHSKYTIDKTHNLYDKVDNLISLLKDKQKTKDKKLMRIVPYSYYPTFQFQLQGLKPDHDRCCICQFQFSDVDPQTQLQTHSQSDIIQLKCSHILHIGCFISLLGDRQWIRCPVCFTIFGVMLGDQPPGTMETQIDNHLHCDGHPEAGTIIISYHFNSGKRDGGHFYGTSRTAFLPDTPEGNEVLGLLKKAFERRLVFTIGTSVTTGQENCVVWNGIHHKSDTSGGASHFGFPDPTYFSRVKLELAAKGVY